MTLKYKLYTVYIDLLHFSLAARVYNEIEVETFCLIEIMFSVKTNHLHIVFKGTFIGVYN